MRTIRHLFKQPEITAKTILKKNNKISHNVRNTLISILPRTQRQYAKTQREYAHMRNLHNKHEQSILNLSNNNRVGIKQSIPYINVTYRQ